MTTSDEFRLQIASLREFLAEVLCEAPDVKTPVRLLARSAELWQARYDRPLPHKNANELRRWLQAWGYQLEPDPETWAPLLVGWKLK